VLVPRFQLEGSLWPAARHGAIGGIVVWFVMTLLSLAIPIAIVVTVFRRIQQVTRRLDDPARLRQAFAESAAAALKRAGADPKAVAKKLEVLGMGTPGERSAADLRDALQQARVAVQTSEEPRMAPMKRSVSAPRVALQRPPRPRRPQPVQKLGGLDMGDRSRLSEPPDISEPHGPLPFSANWLAFAALLGAVAYYVLS